MSTAVRVETCRHLTQPLSVGQPWLNPYHRLLSRYYEHAVLLKLLGGSLKRHKKYPPGQELVKTRHRQFLRNLAYICDFDKGAAPSLKHATSLV